MLNYWWVTRPKRKLSSVPDVLATFSEISLNEEWNGQRDTHLSFEDALEQSGLKRIGERRDQMGGGARTYKAWLASLGLIFIQESTGLMKLTLAGEALMNGEPPVPILKNQVLKYQFPSSFSIGRSVDVSPRFRIRPFKFLLKLLRDSRVHYLTEEEIAKIIITEAENETNVCFERIVSRINEFREKGNSCLGSDFFLKYKSSKGDVNLAHPYSHLTDVANTFVNWLEYTQLISRSSSTITLLEDKTIEVDSIISDTSPLIDRPEQQEFFQRKYGLDPNHKKDTRNLANTQTITPKVIAEHRIKQAYIAESLKSPITKITSTLIDNISEQTGFEVALVEDTLRRLFPRGSIGSFMDKYFHMAFKGRDEATEFEKATVVIFRDIFGFKAEHVGPIGLTPDVFIVSDYAGYAGIIDNKAYKEYSINNDHHNRMVHNYIPTYLDKGQPLAFFSYIAGGFGKHINSQLNTITSETGISGSAMVVSNIINMIERQQTNPYTHNEIKDIFSLNRRVILSDLNI